MTDSIASLVLNTGIVQIGTGGVLKLNGNVSAGGTGNSVIQGNGSLDLNGMTRIFTVSTGRQLTISAPVVGGAGSGLTFTGGTLLFNSALPNTYQGITTVLNGNLNLNSTAVAIPGNLTIGDGVGGPNTAVVNALKSNVIAHSSVVTILTDGNLNIGATSQSIAGLVGSGNVMGVTGGLLTVTVAASTTYIFSGVISGTGLQFTKLGAGVEVLSGTNTYTGTTSVNAGELQLDGRIGPGTVLVNAGGTLGGSGTITGNTDVKRGGIIDPGAAGGGIGTLNVASLLFETGSIYHVDVGLTAAGAITNDRLNGGRITITTGGTAQLQLNSFSGFNGMSINIAHSTVAYGGLFATGVTPMVEGGTYKIGPDSYQITYVAPPGHDVVLSLHRRVDVWTGNGTNNNWSNPKNWASNTVPQPGDALQFPATAQRRFNINDLPVGFEVGEIDFTGSGTGGYNLSGNAIQLDGGIQNSASAWQQWVALDLTVNYTSFWIDSSPTNVYVSGAVHLGNANLYVADIQSGSSTTLAGAITGPTGSVTEVGVGVLTFSGPNSNTFGGKTYVMAGSLELRKANPAIAIAGPLVIGDGVGGLGADVVDIVFDNQISDTAPITVNSSGKLNFGTSLDTIGDITLNGGTVMVGSVLGGINLAGSLTVNQSTTIGQRINLVGGTTHTIAVAPGVTLIVTGQINGTNDGINKTGAGTLTLSGTTEDLYTGTTTVSAGTLNLSKTGVNAIFGPLVVGDGAQAAIRQLQRAQSASRRRADHCKRWQHPQHERLQRRGRRPDAQRRHAGHRRGRQAHDQRRHQCFWQVRADRRNALHQGSDPHDQRGDGRCPDSERRHHQHLQRGHHQDRRRHACHRQQQHFYRPHNRERRYPAIRWRFARRPREPRQWRHNHRFGQRRLTHPGRRQRLHRQRLLQRQQSGHRQRRPQPQRRQPEYRPGHTASTQPNLHHPLRHRQPHRHLRRPSGWSDLRGGWPHVPDQLQCVQDGLFDVSGVAQILATAAVSSRQWRCKYSSISCRAVKERLGPPFSMFATNAHR